MMDRSLMEKIAWHLQIYGFSPIFVQPVASNEGLTPPPPACEVWGFASAQSAVLASFIPWSNGTLELRMVLGLRLLSHDYRPDLLPGSGFTFQEYRYGGDWTALRYIWPDWMETPPEGVAAQVNQLLQGLTSSEAARLLRHFKSVDIAPLYPPWLMLEELAIGEQGLDTLRAMARTVWFHGPLNVL